MVFGPHITRNRHYSVLVASLFSADMFNYKVAVCVISKRVLSVFPHVPSLSDSVIHAFPKY